MISTNAGAVARRLQVYADGLPGAVAAAIEPTMVRNELQTVAENVLLSAAMGETFGKAAKGTGSTERHDRLTGLAKRMAREMVTEVWEGGQSHEIGMGEDRGEKREESKGTASFAQKVEWAQYGSGNWRTVNEVKELVLEWVKGDKNLDPDDIEKGPDAVAEHLLMVMGVRAPKFDGYEGELEAAGDKMKRTIGDWLEGSEEAGDDELVSQWLALVAAAWREVLRQRIPRRLAVQLEKLHWRVRNELGV